MDAVFTVARWWRVPGVRAGGTGCLPVEPHGVGASPNPPLELTGGEKLLLTLLVPLGYRGGVERRPKRGETKDGQNLQAYIYRSRFGRQARQRDGRTVSHVGSR